MGAGNVDGEGGCIYVGAGIYGKYLLSIYLCCLPKIALKKSIHF